MTGKNIAKNYPIFLKFFEDRVTEAQKAMENIRRCEGAYNIMRDALLLSELDHDTKILCNGHGQLSISAHLDKESTTKPFYKLADLIGEKLVEAGMRDKADCAHHDGNSGAYLTWTWRPRANKFDKNQTPLYMTITVYCAYGSLEHEIVNEERVNHYTHSYLKKREPKVYPSLDFSLPPDNPF